MSMTMFVKVFPELGEAETRTLTTFNHPDLPPDRYAFAESYCDERGCDCRRVTFNVIAMEGKRHVATIAHALDDSTPRYDLPRTLLDPMNPQTELSPALLDEFTRTILPDANFQARLLRHYRMFKEVVEDARHPARPALWADAIARPSLRAAPKVGRNDPCPCVSGKKHKKCCLASA